MADSQNAQHKALDFDYRFGFSMPESYAFKAKKGISEKTVSTISKIKKEPRWMTNLRLKAYDIFMKKPMPQWGGDMSHINFDDIYYYLKPINKQSIENF